MHASKSNAMFSIQSPSHSLISPNPISMVFADNWQHPLPSADCPTLTLLLLAPSYSKVCENLSMSAVGDLSAYCLL